MFAPKVSVGMPVYNGERWLPTTIPAILNQTFRDLELVITDNGSTDRTAEICEEFARRDARVRYFRNPKNLGVIRNFNECFKHSRGEFFRWHAASDLCEPTLVERCYDALQRNPDAVCAYPRTRLFVDTIDDGSPYACSLDANQDSAADRFIHVMLKMGLNNAQSGLIRSSVIRKTRLIPNHIDGDHVFLMEISLYGKFIIVPELLWYRRMKPETASTLQSEDWIVRYIDPEMKSPHFQKWKVHRSRFAAVTRAPISWNEKWKAYRELVRRFRWARPELYADLKKAMRGTPAR